MEEAIRRLVRLILVLTHLACSGVVAATPFHQSYGWESAPVLSELTPELQQEGVVILLDLRVVEYEWNDTELVPEQYYTLHSRIRVHTAEAVEAFNKVYIPMDGVREIVRLNVRVVTGQGVRRADSVQLLDYRGAGEEVHMKYFAVEGVEQGAEVEYLYTLRMEARLDGAREVFQDTDHRRKAEFMLIAPAGMTFAFRGYNGFPEPVADTVPQGKIRYRSSMTDLEPLRSEQYAAYYDHLARLEYKLKSMRSSGGAELYSYRHLAAQLDAYFRPGTDEKKAVKKIGKLIRQLGIDQMEIPVRIRAIEDFIKERFTLAEQSDAGYDQLDRILREHVASRRGLLRLFIAAFDQAGVRYEYGLTSDREGVSFDPAFETYSYLEHYFFYFPETGQYLAPSEFFYRLGYLPYNWTHNYGLFIRPLHIGAIDAQWAEIRFIPALPAEDNVDWLDIRYDILGEFDSARIRVRRTLSGYQATYIQPVYSFLPEADLKSLQLELLHLQGKYQGLRSFEVKNGTMRDLYLRPFEIDGTAGPELAFIEKAGNRFLLRVGELIGEQVELYQEKTRHLPVQNEYNRIYRREIRIAAPPGYEVMNLEELNYTVVPENDQPVTMAFQAAARLEGNQIIVVVNEFYRKIDYPVEQFEQFRRVINAAADFNKKVIVFRKTGA
jgi:hypothetical protein